MSYTSKLTYTLHVFESSSDVKFIKAIDVYQKTVSRIEKTSTNEIAWVVDNRKSFQTSMPYFFGLELNNKVIGYAEVAYIKRTRYIAIDYITIDNQYKTHSAFYSFILLIIEHFNSLKIDFDFIGIEILTDFEGTASKEEISEFELEGFKVINSLYMQPSLEKNNFDSQHEAVLMINQRNKATAFIGKKTYCEIVDSLYFDYYYEWDCKFYNNEIERVNGYNQFKKNYDTIVNSCSNSNIILNGYPFKSISSEDKIIPPEQTKSQKLWQALFFVAIFTIMLLGIILAIKKMNIEFAIVIVIFIALIFLWLSFLAFSEDKAMKLLSKIPILSKLIELLK